MLSNRISSFLWILFSLTVLFSVSLKEYRPLEWASPVLIPIVFRAFYTRGLGHGFLLNIQRCSLLRRGESLRGGSILWPWSSHVAQLDKYLSTYLQLKGHGSRPKKWLMFPLSCAAGWPSRSLSRTVYFRCPFYLTAMLLLPSALEPMASCFWETPACCE